MRSGETKRWGEQLPHRFPNQAVRAGAPLPSPDGGQPKGGKVFRVGWSVAFGRGKRKKNRKERPAEGPPRKENPSGSRRFQSECRRIAVLFQTNSRRNADVRQTHSDPGRSPSAIFVRSFVGSLGGAVTSVCPSGQN